MTWMMNLGIGVVYALVFVAIVRLAKRFQNPLLAIAILGAALPYVVLGLGVHPAAELEVELVGVLLFAGLAAVGVWISPWALAGAWALHAAWDVVVPLLVDTAYMPVWYEAVCVGFDLVITLYLVSIIRAWIPATGFRSAAAG